MSRTTSRFVPLASALSVLACAGVPPAAIAAPAISSVFATPEYAVAASCDLTKPLVVLNLIVRNDGDATTFPMPIETNDAAGGFTGRAMLPRLEPGDQIAVQLALRHAASNPGRVGGVHAVTVVIGTRPMRPLLVSVPATLCAAGGPAPTPAATPNATPTPVTAPATTGVRPRTKRATPSPVVSNVGPNTSALIAASLKPAAPSNVHNIGDHGAECLPHVGALGTLVCPDMIRSGDLLLVWDWRPASGPDDVDGFRVYRVDSGRKELTYTRTDKKDLTLADLPKPAGGYTGRCYAVSAFIGKVESDLSPAFCASGGSVAKTIRLSATHTRNSHRYRTEKGFGDLSFGAVADDPQGPMVGFEYSSEKRTFGDSLDNAVHRAAIAFDVAKLANRRLVSAKLLLTVASSDGQGNNHSCASDIGTGREFWWQNTKWLDASFDLPNHADGADIALSDTGPQISADVTQMVAAWLRGNPNYGFVLKNSGENIYAFTNQKCITVYSNPLLEITYY